MLLTSPSTVPSAVLALVAASLLAVTAVRAQPSPARISQLESATDRLMFDLRIEGADSNGSRTYVAFGSAVDDGAGEPHRALMLSVVTNATASEPIAATSRAARPSRFVRVIATRDGVTVVWYDRRRAAHGVYARRFDRDGTPIEAERLVVAGYIVDLPAEPLLPNRTVVLRTNGSTVMLDSTGALASDELASPAFLSPHVVLGDSSMLSIVGGRLIRRTHFAATQPADTIDLRFVSPTLHNAWVLTLDSTGSPWLVFLEEDLVPPSTCLASVSAGVKVRRAEIDLGAGDVGPAVTVDSFYTCDVSAFGARLESASLSRIGGGHEMAILLARTFPGDSSTLTIRDTSVLAIGPMSQFAPTRVRSGRWSSGRVELIRLASDSMSRVATRAAGVVVEHAIAPLPSGIDQTAPAFLDGTLRRIAWRESVNDRRLFVLAAIDALVATPLDTVVGFDHRYRRPSTPSSIEGERSTLWAPAGPPVVVSSAWERAFATTSQTGVTFSTVSAYVAKQDGWRPVLEASDRAVTVGPGGAFTTARIGVGLESSVVVAVDHAPRRIIVRVDGPTGTTDSSSSSELAPMDFIVPIDRVHWGYVAGDTLRVADPDIVGGSVMLPPAEARETVWKKSSSGLLLRAAISTDGRVIRLVELDDRGVIRARGQVDLDTEARGLAVVPAEGGSLVALFETARGLEGASFAAGLVPLGTRLLVGSLHDSIAHVTGEVSRGVLHLAWEQAREGVSDIFGVSMPLTALQAPLGPSAPDVDGIITRIDAGQLFVSARGLSSSSTMILYDLLGRCVAVAPATRDGGYLNGRFEVSALPRSVYVVVINGAGHESQARRVWLP